jgi:hypothetical protein
LRFLHCSHARMILSLGILIQTENVGLTIASTARGAVC